LKDLVFLDESGANLQMQKRFGRGFIGKRIKIFSPYKKGNKFTMLSAINHEEVLASLYLEGAANGEIFLQFIKDCLCPVLKKENVVVMDNVSFHKVVGIEEAIKNVGAELIYLPPYSPEMNPIELMWAKIKSYLRKKAARNIEKFHSALKQAFESITAKDLTNWFKHCVKNGSTF